MTYPKNILKQQKKKLVSYLLSKVEAEDWHAVQDAASDIREINAKLIIIESMKDKIGGGK